MRLIAAIFITGAFVLAAVGSCPNPARAQEVQRIAALVNDQVISAYDVEQRVRLVVSTSGLNPTPDALERVREQVLRTLVDEELQLQEAAQAELEISDPEIDSAIERLAGRNNMTRQQIVGILAQNGVSETTLRRQIHAGIAWDTITQGRFSSQISVTEEEIDQALEQLEANSDKPQYWIMELFMGVDSPEEDESVRRAAMRFVEQVRTGEASFSELARQFSQAPSAGAGGDVGWVTAEDLAPQLAEAVTLLRPGTLSQPIRTISGYYIIVLRARRIGNGARPDQIKMKLRQIVVPAPEGYPQRFMAGAADAAMRIAAAQPRCDQIEAILDDSQGLMSSDLGERYVSDLTPEFQNAVSGLVGGDSTQPVQTNAGFHVLTVCDQSIEGSMLPAREVIEDRLFQQQLSMVQRRYLRDLRRDATVEMR